MNVTIFADASWCPEYKVGGYGFWIASARGKAGGGGALKEPVDTATIAEMMALCNALAIGVRKRLVMPADIVLMQTESVSVCAVTEKR